MPARHASTCAIDLTPKAEPMGYHIFLQRKVGEHVDAMMETETNDGRG